MKTPREFLPFEFCQVQSVYPKVTVDQFFRWYTNPDHRYHCVFCGAHFKGKRPSFCTCKEYKGIEPCFAETEEELCQLDAGWKPE